MRRWGVVLLGLSVAAVAEAQTTLPSAVVGPSLPVGPPSPAVASALPPAIPSSAVPLNAMPSSAVPSPYASSSSTSLLGDRYSGLFDVSFRPFTGSKLAERQTPSEIARFSRDDKQWLLIFSRIDLQNDLPLKDREGVNGVIQGGYLTTAVGKLRNTDSAADVLRNEILDLGDLQIGVINAVTHDRGKPLLLQQAIMQVTPRLYYTLSMTSPLEQADANKSPLAKDAATTFKAMLDSVEKVDLSELKHDQDLRLFRTRGLFAAWDRKKLTQTLVPDRYLRFKKEGKEIGYAYVVEQLANGLPKAGQPAVPAPEAEKATGFRVGVRTHTLTDDGKIVDVESWMYTAFDRGHEIWSVVTVVNDPNAKNPRDRTNAFSELGNTDMESQRVFDNNLNSEDFRDADKRGERLYHDVTNYTMEVRNADRNLVAEPIKFGLPPWYLPEALQSMLPRLVPLDNPTGYLFAGYISSNHKLMHRYIDVGPMETVKIDGVQSRAVGVSERIGFSGTVTKHYFTRQGDYLGTVNTDSHTEVLPTDRATLSTLWKDINLNPPAGTK